jgi:hypothetical protein
MSTDLMERANALTLVPEQERETAETQPRKLTETEARSFLAAYTTAGKAPPSHRDLATAWGWHRSKVARFLARSTETKTETRPATPARERPIATSGPVTTDWVMDALEDGSVLLHEQPMTAQQAWASRHPAERRRLRRRSRHFHRARISRPLHHPADRMPRQGGVTWPQPSSLCAPRGRCICVAAGASSRRSSTSPPLRSNHPKAGAINGTG